MARETGVQSQLESYQRLKKWYLMPPCLTLSIIRYGSRVKWSNPGKEVAPFPTPWCSSYRRGSLRVTLDYVRQLYLLIVILEYSEFYFQTLYELMSLWWLCLDLMPTYVAFNRIQSVYQWSGRPGFNLRSSHTKDLKNGTCCPLA